MIHGTLNRKPKFNKCAVGELFLASTNSGTLIEQVRLGNGCMHLSIFRDVTSFTNFCLLYFFLLMSKFLHPSIEISKKGIEIIFAMSTGIWFYSKNVAYTCRNGIRSKIIFGICLQFLPLFISDAPNLPQLKVIYINLLWAWGGYECGRDLLYSISS